MSIHKNIIYNKHIGVSGLLDLYIPNNVSFDAVPLFIFFFGGGIENGSKESLLSLAMELIKRGIAFAAPNYRLYPHAKYPEFIDDAANATAWCIKNIDKYCKTSDIFIGGVSAGAYLSMMLCFDKRYLAHHDIDADKISGYLFGGAQPTSHFNVLKERGLDTRCILVDESAPLYHVRKDGAPMQILVSKDDRENRLEQTRLLYSTLKHFRYSSDLDYRELPGTHCSYFHKNNDGKIELVDIVCSFIKKHVHKTL